MMATPGMKQFKGRTPLMIVSRIVHGDWMAVNNELLFMRLL